MEKIENQTFDQERALYHLENTNVIHCRFAGVEDGESVLKEVRNCTVQDCIFSLRYPLWHAKKFMLIDSKMDEFTRAPIWYSYHGTIQNCLIRGLKCLRECQDIQIFNTKIDSKEFGWRCQDIQIKECEIQSEYFLFESQNIKINQLQLTGKYTFQYCKKMEIKNSYLDTKDAFWHAENVVVSDSVIKGEYLGWFSKNLTLIRCKIIGTQPLCYCKNLKLIDCEMENTDLAFEYSSVKATIKGNVLSIKNPKSGTIYCDSVGEIIKENPIMPCTGKIILSPLQRQKSEEK